MALADIVDIIVQSHTPACSLPIIYNYNNNFILVKDTRNLVRRHALCGAHAGNGQVTM